MAGCILDYGDIALQAYAFKRSSIFAGNKSHSPHRKHSANIDVMTFRKLTDDLLVAPQITVDAVAEAAAEGVRLIINNRPEDESADQTPGPEIEAAAKAAGLAYVAIPVTHAGFSEWQMLAMADAVDGAQGKILAYCRSGTRSTLLWSLVQAKAGMHPAEIAERAAGAGYDVASISLMLDTLYAAR